jgi:hypothetical protein
MALGCRAPLAAGINPPIFLGTLYGFFMPAALSSQRKARRRSPQFCVLRDAATGKAEHDYGIASALCSGCR